MLTIVMIKMSIFGEISWWWEFPTALFYTFSKCRWNYIVTHRINKLIHLWLWHFDLHLPLDRVCLNTVNSTIGNGGLSRFRSRQSSTPGACCSKFPAWSLHTFAALAQKKEASSAFLCWWTFNISISKRANWLEHSNNFFLQMKLRKTLGKHVTLMWSEFQSQQSRNNMTQCDRVQKFQILFQAQIFRIINFINIVTLSFPSEACIFTIMLAILWMSVHRLTYCHLKKWKWIVCKKWRTLKES